MYKNQCEFPFALKPSVRKIKVLLLTAALGSGVVVNEELAAKEPAFDFLPRHGLPNMSFGPGISPRPTISARQLVNIDGDRDLDLILNAYDSSTFTYTAGAYIKNLGTLNAPAFETKLSTISIQVGLSFADIDNNGSVDAVTSLSLDEIDSPLILLDVTQDFDSIVIEDHQWLSFADLVGEEEATRVKSLIEQARSQSSVIKFVDLDNDGDSDLEILYSLTKAGLNYYDFYIDFENVVLPDFVG